MKDLSRLLYKDLKLNRFFLIFLPVITGLWHVFLTSRPGLWQGMPPAAIPLAFLPLILLPFWALLVGFNSWRQEWREKTIFLLGTLPVSGIKLVTAKLLALLALVIIILVVFIISLIVFIDMTIIQESIGLNMFFIEGAKILLLFLFFITIIAVLTQWTYITSRLVERFSGLAAFLIFFISAWGIVRAGALLQPVFAWVPLITFSDFTITDNGYSSSVYLDMSNILSLLAVAALLHLASGYLLEREIDF